MENWAVSTFPVQEDVEVQCVKAPFIGALTMVEASVDRLGALKFRRSFGGGYIEAPVAVAKSWKAEDRIDSIKVIVMRHSSFVDISRLFPRS